MQKEIKKNIVFLSLISERLSGIAMFWFELQLFTPSLTNVG